jgi:hypothetical protein
MTDSTRRRGDAEEGKGWLEVRQLNESWSWPGHSSVPPRLRVERLRTDPPGGFIAPTKFLRQSVDRAAACSSYRQIQ